MKAQSPIILFNIIADFKPALISLTKNTFRLEMLFIIKWFYFFYRTNKPEFCLS